MVSKRRASGSDRERVLDDDIVDSDLAGKEECKCASAVCVMLGFVP